ncbi:MAG: hypothetical protein LKE96_07875 [Acetobacter peroxydans]|nr:hypothetical protein [Acetobacter peroxydans]
MVIINRPAVEGSLRSAPKSTGTWLDCIERLVHAVEQSAAMGRVARVVQQVQLLADKVMYLHRVEADMRMRQPQTVREEARARNGQWQPGGRRCTVNRVLEQLRQFGGVTQSPVATFHHQAGKMRYRLGVARVVRSGADLLLYAGNGVLQALAQFRG